MPALLDRLKGAEVRCVIDVRAIAASRRPGFSKTALSAALREHGIDYIHLRALGTPAEGREAARRGDVARMREVYAVQLATPEAEVAMMQANACAMERASALLCFEAEAGGCHRAVVAERLSAGYGRLDVVDL